jgi:saccharopine dehydrogenase (NADP+, L-glutamate forming)
MQELDGPAKNVGITVLNEVGFDPGVDHLYAIKVIGEVHDKGGKVCSALGILYNASPHCPAQVREFYSYCGGLPAPEAADNPLRFKV